MGGLCHDVHTVQIPDARKKGNNPMSATYRHVYNAVHLTINGAMRDIDNGLANEHTNRPSNESGPSCDCDLYDVLDAVAQCLGDWAENLDPAEQLDIAQRVTARGTQYIP